MDDHVTKTIATYDRFAADWVDVANNHEIDSWIQESIREFNTLLPTPKVLVPGCGDGRDSHSLGDLGNEVESFDLSTGMLEIASTRADAGKFWQMDLRDINTIETLYGGVFASGCLYHLSPDEFVQFVSDTAHILIPNGVFYLNMKIGEGVEMRRVPTDNYPGGAEAQARLQGDRYYAYYSEPELTEILSRAFEVRSKRTMEPHTEEVLEYWLVVK